MTDYDLEALEFVRENHHIQARFDDVRTVLNRLIKGLDWKTGKERDDPWNGCFTGDCPHETGDECVKHLAGYVAELEKHDCEQWAMEGIGCANCNPAARAIRSAAKPEDV